MFENFKYNIHILRTKTLPTKIYFQRTENDQINDIILNLQTIIREYLSPFSSDNKFQSLLRYISQLLIQFQIQSNCLSTETYQPGEQPVPDGRNSLKKIERFSSQSSKTNDSPLKQENIQIMRSIDKVDCPYIIDDVFDPNQIMTSYYFDYVRRQTKELIRETNVLETINKLIFENLINISSKKTFNRCSSAYISKRARKSNRQRNNYLSVCYRHFPVSVNAQKRCINHMKTSIDVRKMPCNNHETETDPSVISLENEKQSLFESSSDLNLSSTNVPKRKEQSNNKLLGQIFRLDELYICILYQSPWQITIITSHMVSACIRISLDCRVKASILQMGSSCLILSESEVDYYWQYNASINTINANEDKEIGHKENENIIFHLKNSLKIDDKIISKSNTKHSKIMKIDSISKISKTFRIMTIPRRSIDDLDLSILNQQSIHSLSIKNISKRKLKLNRTVFQKSRRRIPCQQLKDPCRILNSYAQFQCL